MPPPLAESLASNGFLHKSPDWPDELSRVADADVVRALRAPPRYSPRRLATLTSPAAAARLEDMALAARKLTRQRFGRAIKLFAPLYLSNHCINRCRYCGFNAGHAREKRRRLALPEALAEGAALAAAGFRDLLLVSGEDNAHVTVDYLAQLARNLRGAPENPGRFAAVSVEIARLAEDEYRRLAAAGVDGVTLFQETYDMDAYPGWHPGGPKADGRRRLAASESAARAGMRRLGLGALLGLEDWRFEARALAAHADWLMRNFWRAQIGFSLPRLRPAAEVDAGAFPHLVSDADLVQLMTALRLCFPDAAITLSTREPAWLRDRLIPLGATQISAGSRTDPGGYANAGNATAQFATADNRGAAEMAAWLAEHGFDPVWKDWDAGF